MKKTLFLLFFAFIFRANAAESMLVEPKIVDGDSITLKIRMYGIDAPEHDQKFGKEAREHLISLVKDKKVSCYKKSYDGYGRIVAECFLGDININAEMVKSGHAWAYRKYGDDYNKLEDKAKAEGIGIWADKNPTPPWLYRKQKRDALKNKAN